MKRVISVFLAVIILTAILAIPASARASNQIASYSIGIVPQGSGKVQVTVNVNGTHRNMTRIGFPSIALYERVNSGGSWSPVFSTGPHYNPNATAGSHTYTFTYQGVAGRQYYSYSTFFARDADGSDTRGASSPIITAT